MYGDNAAALYFVPNILVDKSNLHVLIENCNLINVYGNKKSDFISI